MKMYNKSWVVGLALLMGAFSAYGISQEDALINDIYAGSYALIDIHSGRRDDPFAINVTNQAASFKSRKAVWMASMNKVSSFFDPLFKKEKLTPEEQILKNAWTDSITINDTILNTLSAYYINTNPNIIKRLNEISNSIPKLRAAKERLDLQLMNIGTNRLKLEAPSTVGSWLGSKTAKLWDARRVLQALLTVLSDLIGTMITYRDYHCSTMQGIGECK